MLMGARYSVSETVHIGIDLHGKESLTVSHCLNLNRVAIHMPKCELNSDGVKMGCFPFQLHFQFQRSEQAFQYESQQR